MGMGQTAMVLRVLLAGAVVLLPLRQADAQELVPPSREVPPRYRQYIPDAPLPRITIPDSVLATLRASPEVRSAHTCPMPVARSAPPLAVEIPRSVSTVPRAVSIPTDRSSCWNPLARAAPSVRLLVPDRMPGQDPR